MKNYRDTGVCVVLTYLVPRTLTYFIYIIYIYIYIYMCVYVYVCIHVYYTHMYACKYHVCICAYTSNSETTVSFPAACDASRDVQTGTILIGCASTQDASTPNIFVTSYSS